MQYVHPLSVVMLLWAATYVRGSSTSVPNMIVIMLDGFRWDYPVVHGGEGLPGLAKFSTNGVGAKYLNPVFPANTFPNWHTIATGLYPESHGIVANYMYDLERKTVFSQDSLELTEDPVWWREAEPLWITATKNHLDTALILWARCDLPWEGQVLPRYCEAYDFTASSTIANLPVKLRRALDMIQNEGYKLVMLYDWAVDTIGHYHGPMSPQMASIVRGVDTVLQELWQDLEARGMMNTTNVVLLSDHGMTDTAPGQVETVDVSGCLQQHQDLYVTEFGSYINIAVAPGYTQQVVEEVRTCPGVEDKLLVYGKEDLPERYHYKAHRLIGQVIVIAKQGYFISVSGIQPRLPEKEPHYKGNHGFDNTEGQNPDMRGILLAHGPGFARGVEAGGVEQVDVYGLLCRALHLSCHPNNGSMERVAPFFASDQTQVATPFSVVLLAVPILMLTSLALTWTYSRVWSLPQKKRC